MIALTMAAGVARVHAGFPYNIVDNFVDIKIKAYIQGAETVQGDAASAPVYVVSLTTRDIINLIGKQLGANYDKATQLIHQRFYNQNGEYLNDRFELAYSKIYPATENITTLCHLDWELMPSILQTRS